MPNIPLPSIKLQLINNDDGYSFSSHFKLNYLFSDYMYPLISSLCEHIPAQNT